MSWHDLFYFSKGERRALTLLLCLIVVSWILLLRTDTKRMPVESPPDAHRTEIPAEGRIIIGESIPKEKSILSAPVNSLPKEKKRKEHSPFPRTEKYAPGTLVELNTSDTTILKKVPGIGSTFARRIIKYRELLGGFYEVGQLAEVYGIDEERYQALAPWFIADTLHIRRLEVNASPASLLRKHPYLNYRQAKAIEQLRKQKSRLTGWENLQLLEEFTDRDRKRLAPYLSFR